MTEFARTTLDGVLEITPKRFGDNRGFFSESYSQRDFEDHGIKTVFVQDNHSLSAIKGTVRGLHFQAPPSAQAKLVRCGRGSIFDVAVDIRCGSPTYGQWYGTELSFENGRQLLIPEGFLHGFMTLEDDCEIVYKCSDFYAPQCDGGVRWNDPDIGIRWPGCGAEPVLSAKDETAPLFKDFTSPFTFEEIPA